MKNADLGITPEDAMPTVQEVARFFGVPPHMINDETPTTKTSASKRKPKRNFEFAKPNTIAPF